MPPLVTEADAAADHHHIEHADAAAVGEITVIKSVKKRKAAEPNTIFFDEKAPSEKIFQEAVADIKDILARQDRDQDRDWRRIGEIAISVGKAYGEDRIGKLAKAVNLAADTLRRYRKVTKLAQEIESKSAPRAGFELLGIARTGEAPRSGA
jgi:hypothetical protein